MSHIDLLVKVYGDYSQFFGEEMMLITKSNSEGVTGDHIKFLVIKDFFISGINIHNFISGKHGPPVL